MSNVRAFRAGNWSDTNTTTSPWATGGVLYAPDSTDDVYLNGFTVTVDNSPTVVSVTNFSATSRLWKDGATTTAASGGSLILTNGVTLTATTSALTTVGANFITISGTNSASFVGNITGHPSYAYSVVNSGSGTLTYTGYTQATGAGGGTFRNQSAGSVVINGGVTSSPNSVVIYQDIGGNLTVNGYVTSNGAIGIANNAAGTVTVVGTMTASNGGGNAIRSVNVYSLVRASGDFICASDGTMAVAAIKMILNTSPTSAKTRYALNGTGTYVDMFTADNNLTQAAPADVRSGTVYADGNLTGTLAVPAAASVGFGVPVDATTGTAVLDPQAVANAVWNEVLTGATHNVNRSAGKRLRQLGDERIIADGDTQSATSDTITLEAIGTLCVGQTIVVTDQSTGDKQTRYILAYNAGTNTATVDSPWCSTPTAEDAYLITTVRDPLIIRASHPEGTVGAEIDELHLIHGLKSGSALTVTPTSRAAGSVSQTIGGDGTTTTTVTRA